MQKQIWLSPLRMDGRQWLHRSLPLLAGTAALIAVDRRIARGLPNSDDQVRWSNRVSHAGGLYTLAAVTALPLLTGRSGRHPAAFSVGESALHALASAATVNYALKYSLGRERPDMNVGNGPFFRAGDSFPSGHAMTTWAICTAIARHKRTPTWLKFVSYGVATTVSLSRMGARRHFASDVFAGAVLGGMIGNYSTSRAR
jgi:membrane-associated phospholipid phosphatase